MGSSMRGHPLIWAIVLYSFTLKATQICLVQLVKLTPFLFEEIKSFYLFTTNCQWIMEQQILSDITHTFQSSFTLPSYQIKQTLSMQNGYSVMLHVTRCQRSWQ